MVRTPCFIANWKMNKAVREAESYLSSFMEQCAQAPLPPSQVIVAPPFTALYAVSKRLSGDAGGIGLAAQNVHYEVSGAFTGEVSTGMLCEVGCQYVIIGHSERRALFGESDAVVQRKLSAVRKAALLPVLCIGETLKDRRAGQTWERLQGQLSTAFTDDLIATGLADNVADWMIAYEPVWAIGTGETPTPDEVKDVHAQVRTFIESRVGKGSPSVLYGGSVSEKNIAAFMEMPGIDGVLVGGASLSPESFYKVIEAGARAGQAARLEIEE